MDRKRVVTGFNTEGQSIVVSIGAPPARHVAPNAFDEIWAFDGVPANLSDDTDPADVSIFRLAPATGRIACRIFTTPPSAWPVVPVERVESTIAWDYSETQRIDGQPGMHQTPTVDVIVVISGEMDLVLDSGETVHLHPGDSVIQRGTMHDWQNHGTEPCVAVAFMVRAEYVTQNLRQDGTRPASRYC